MRMIWASLPADATRPVGTRPLTFIGSKLVGLAQGQAPNQTTMTLILPRVNRDD